MSELSAQKLSDFYEKYKNQELAFNKSIIQTLGVETNKICLKIKGDPWPCILYSCSMTAAKIIINLDESGFERIRKANKHAMLRLSFFPETAKTPITFFVAVQVKDYRAFDVHDSNVSAFLMTIEFTTKPSEDLIEILGRVFEQNENFDKRRALRVNVDEKMIGLIGLATTKAIMEMNGSKRQCIIKNMSSSGIMALIACDPDRVVKQKMIVHMVEAVSRHPISIEGTVMRTEKIAGSDKIFGLGIMFDPEKIPFTYKNMLNSYIDKLEVLKHKMETVQQNQQNQQNQF